MDRTCAGCPTRIVSGPRERNKRRWCSQSCRARTLRLADPDRNERRRATYAAMVAPLSHQAVCANCGGRCRNGKRYCAAVECQRARGREAAAKAYAADRERHVQRMRDARESESPEQREIRLAKTRERIAALGYTEAKRARDARRRAAKLGALVEMFKNVEVFDRDGWICGICHRPVDRDLVYPDPGSVSLDHIVPLSLGGEHSRANTRCSHLTCNISRGAARTGTTQLALL